MSLDDPQKNPLSERQLREKALLANYERSQALKDNFENESSMNVSTFIDSYQGDKEKAAKIAILFLKAYVQENKPEKMIEALSAEGAVPALVEHGQAANVLKLIRYCKTDEQAKIMATPGVKQAMTSEKADDTPTLVSQIERILPTLEN